MTKSILLQRLNHSSLSHTTTGLARRALLLVSFLLLGLGSAWGQTFNTAGTMVDGGVVKDVYLDILSLSEKEIAINQIDVINALNSFGSNWTADNIADNIYIRWSLLDENDDFASNVTNDQWNYQNGEIYFASIDYNLQTRKDIAGFYYFKQAYSNVDFSQVLRAKVQVDRYSMFNKTLEDFKDHTIVCYITDDLSGITPPTYDQWGNMTAGAVLNNEPAFKLKYVFHFGPKIDDFTNGPRSGAEGTTTGAKSKEIETEAPQNIDLSYALAKTPNVDYKYVRIYLENNGKVVDPDGKLTVSYNGTSIGLNADFKERGYYYYKEDGALQASDFEVTLNVLGGEFENYQVVCVFAKDVDGNWDNKEPEWDLQYTYSFEYPFKGKVTDETVKMETTFEVPVSMQEGQFNVSFDYDNNLAKLDYYTSQWTQSPVSSVSIDGNFLDAFPNKTLGNTDKFYVRWFLRKDGEEVYVPNVIVDAGDGIYSSPAKGRYYYWSTSKNDGKNDLSKILKIKLDTSVLPSKLTGYELVFTVATDLEGETYDSGNLTHEPNKMAYEYTFRFVDKPFETELIVKTISKVATYDKTEGMVTPDLFTNSDNVVKDLGNSPNVSDCYLRWYAIDTKGNLVDITAENTEWEFSSEANYTKNAYGYYIEPTAWNNLDPTITLPAGIREEYKKYQIVCVITKKKSTGNLPDYEPTSMDVRYIFSLMTEDEQKEFETLSFVHYKGFSGRDWETPKNSNGSMTQRYWNDVTGDVEEHMVDIRQGVHTWEYDIYFTPGEECVLALPFQDYLTTGQDLEPQAYIRWYNWNTDKSVVENEGTFTFKGNFLVESSDKRGLFYIYQGKDEDLKHSNIGVIFQPANNSNSIDIACDVSKYSDGMVGVSGKYSLLHEPTLSNRYIFHLHPASEMAERLYLAKEKMAETISNAEELYKVMSNLEEDKGKVVVSLGTDKSKSKFSLRFDLPKRRAAQSGELSWNSPHNYVLKNGTDYVHPDEVQWYAYFEDKNGVVGRKKLSITDNNRIADFTSLDFTSGTYSSLNGETIVDPSNGRNFHVVGYLGNEGFNVESNSGIYAPIVHYELHFIDAPAIPLDDILAGNVEGQYLNRTELYMQANNYTQAAVVDFDGNPETNPNVVGKEAQYYSTQNWYDAPTSSADNLTYVPFPWEDIQYSFCYPELTSTIRNGMNTGVAPEHSDYIVVKSMNVASISESIGYDNYSEPITPPYNYYWWGERTVLHDYTYYATKGKQHGSFLYTDASDESRTIAKIPFTATDLCGGSSIYFTAVVANETEGAETSHTPPQLLIRIVGKDGDNRKRIVAFHTGELSTANGVSMGKWYQVYGATTLSKDFDSSITQFEAEVINYASGALGADFAFDQFAIYTTTAKVLLTQTPSSDCGPETIADNKVQAYMEAEGLQNEFGVTEEAQPIYWRIYEQVEGGDDILITGVGMYPQYGSDGILRSDDSDEETRNTYGITYVVSNYNAKGVVIAEHPNTPETFGWYKDAEGNYFFQIANKSFSALERGKNYYVSIYTPTEEFDENDRNNWGCEDIKCSIYSDFFIPRRQYVTYIVDPETGKEGGELTMECGSDEVEVKGIQMVLKVPDPNDKITGFKTYPMNFDYAFCSMEDWDKSDVYLEGTTKYTYNDLAQAWRDYRDQWLQNNSLTPENYSNSEHEQYSGALNYAIEHNILILDNESTFTHRFTKNETNRYHVICLPITTTTSDGAVVCDAFEVIFNIKTNGGPSLILGFDDVDYSKVDGYRVVRVGLEQIKNMQSNGYLLHIPVNMFKEDVNGEKNEGELEIDGDYLELLPNTSPNLTTDRNVTSVNKNVAKFIGDNDGRLIINSDRMYISLNFHGEGISPQNFYEGFTYHMFFQVKKAGEEEGACEAPVNFLLKVVPEFVTWNGGNNQWNSDGNWNRSTRKELYKGEAGGTQNTETKAHPDGYKNNTEINSKLTNNPDPAFVPMKFTYVTVPSVEKAPNLSNLEIDGKEGIYKNTSLNDDIRYDLMVRYTEEKCLGHDDSPAGTENVYDCEKFYGNWAKEIYFKPGAELVNQHYLTYEKVWVEKLLTANTWTLMSTPLQNTYAGDMYVPAVAIPDYSKDDGATVIGQQVTEAFQPITFADEDKNGKKIYSRTAYPIYQRSWGMKDGMVYTKKEDVRGSDYSALLKFPTKTVETTFVEWSHTYNDVQVPYSTWMGFAIRAHKKQSTDALIRLPKIDKGYSYYQWDGNTPQETAQTTTDLDKNKYAKLFTDDENATYQIGGDNVTYGVAYNIIGEDLQEKSQDPTTTPNATIEVHVSELQNVDGYLLVGNPYLCSIKVSDFLDVNKNILGNEYWTYEDNTSKTQPAEIKPLQSFFVKLNNDATGGDIVFNESMMVGNNGTNGAMPTPALTLTASNGRGQSSATLSVGEEARSVETLFDSNLEDVPMVYTVADGQAVSIHQLTELDRPIAFGVTCAASDETVEVTFTDVAQLTTGDVFVVDAVTGSQTAVGEGSVLGIQPNDYGRYFLLAGTTTIGSDRVDVQKGIVVSVRGKEVTITSGEELTQVRALSLSGASVYQDAVHGLTTSFTLSSGVYIIQAENVAGEQQTVKVVVR